MKVNIDLSAAAAENLIDDELKNNVGAAAINLDHDFFYGSTELEIWTGAGQTITQLIEDTDYTLGDIDANFTARAGRNVYTTVTIDNVTYQTGDLYFTYQATADYVDADDRYSVVRATGQYWILTAGGAFELYTTDVTVDSVKIDTLGGVDIDVDSGFRIDENSGAYFNMSTIGEILMGSASTKAISLQASGNATLQSVGGKAIITSSSSLADAVQLNAPGGGIDVDAVLGIHIQDLYGATGTGGGLTLIADNNNASGTGGDVTIQAKATSGTSGNIVVDSEGNLTLNDQYTTSGIPFSESGETGLDTTATSVIGAINEVLLLTGGAGGDLDGAYNLGSAIAVDSTDVDWLLSAAHDFRIYDGTDGDKFVVTEGAGIKIDTAAGVDIDSGTNSFFSVTTGDLTLETITSGTLTLKTTTAGDIVINSAGAVDIDAATGQIVDITSDTEIQINGGTLVDIDGIGITLDATAGDIRLTAAGTNADIVLTTTGSSSDINLFASNNIALTGAGGISLYTTNVDVNVFTSGAGIAKLFSSGSGDVDIYTSGAAAEIKIHSDAATITNSIQMYSTAGGIDIDTALGVTIDETYTGAGTGGGIALTADVNNASGTGGDIVLSTTATSGTPGKIEFYSDSSMRLDSATGFIVWELLSVGIYQGSSNVGVSFSTQVANLKAERGINITNDYDTTGTSGDIIISSQNSSSGTGADIILQTTGGAGTPGHVEVQTAGFVRVIVGNDGDTIFYGTASTSGALPVITLDQADTDEPFLKFIGDAASADLARNIIDTGDVTTPTIVGYIKIEILDDGDQVTDGDYFVPFYSIV